VTAFGLANLVELLLATTITVAVYHKTRPEAQWWTPDWSIVGGLIRDGWPLAISSIAISLYMRIDQVMLGQLLGRGDVGIYSAALRISEIWYFVPVSVVSTVFPTIVRNRSDSPDLYLRRVSRLYTLMIWSGIVVAVLFDVASPWMVSVLYGNDFRESVAILRVHIWAGIPTALGVAYGAVLAAENSQVITLYATVLGAVANIILNWFLIPTQHAKGAAIATLISQWIVVLSILLFRKSRQTGIAIIKSFVLR